MYTEVFTTGSRLLEEAAVSFGISMNPQPGSRPVAITTSHWGRSEVVKVPKDTDITHKQVAEDCDYALVSSPGAGLASVVDVNPSSVVSGKLKSPRLLISGYKF